MIVALGLVAVVAFVALDASRPRSVVATSSCLPLDDDGTCVIAVVRRHRLLAPAPVLEVRDPSGATVREQSIPLAGELERTVLPDLYLLTLHDVPDDDEPEWMRGDDDEGARPPRPDPSAGTCIVARADARVLFCTAEDGDVEGTLVLRGPGGGTEGGMLLEIRGPAPRTIDAYPLDGHGLAWTTPVDPRWDPPGSEAHAWLRGYVARDGSIEAVGLRIGERYFSVAIGTGAVTLASPEDATGVCTEGRFIAASVGSELRVSLAHPLAFRTVATPGPGVLGRCRTLASRRREDSSVEIEWCFPDGRCEPYPVDSSLAIAAPPPIPAATDPSATDPSATDPTAAAAAAADVGSILRALGAPDAPTEPPAPAP